MTVVDWIAMGLLISLLFTQPKRKLPTPIEWTTLGGEGGNGDGRTGSLSRLASPPTKTGSGPLEPVPPHTDGLAAPHSSTASPSPLEATS